MESRGSSNPNYQCTIRAPKSDWIIEDDDYDSMNIVVDTNNVSPDACFKREADQYLPIANVIKIMRRVLPGHVKISDDSKEIIQECISEFITFVTSKAKERCQNECRRTITADDVLSAMKSIGFDNYIDPLTIFLNKYRAQNLERKSKRNDPNIAMHTMNFVHPQLPQPQPQPAIMSYVQQPQFVHPEPVVARPLASLAHPVPPPSMPTIDHNAYTELSQILDYYLSNRNASGESSSSSSRFDPYKAI